ncbi:hypothetical protein GCM10027594_04520 [Hymenobacter agri]
MLANGAIHSQRTATSPRYLNDLLKQKTGKTALEHIHLFLVAATGYRGFNYPPYFSRLFKK